VDDDFGAAPSPAVPAASGSRGAGGGGGGSHASSSAATPPSGKRRRLTKVGNAEEERKSGIFLEREEREREREREERQRGRSRFLVISSDVCGCCFCSLRLERRFLRFFYPKALPVACLYIQVVQCAVQASPGLQNLTPLSFSFSHSCKHALGAETLPILAFPKPKSKVGDMRGGSASTGRRASPGHGAGDDPFASDDGGSQHSGPPSPSPRSSPGGDGGGAGSGSAKKGRPPKKRSKR